MDALERATGIPVPAPLANLRGLPVRHRDAVARENMLAYVKEALR